MVKLAAVAVAAMLVTAGCSSSDGDEDAAPDASTAEIEEALAFSGELSDSQIAEIAAATGPTCEPARVQQVAAEAQVVAEATGGEKVPAAAEIPEGVAPEEPASGPGGVIVVSESDAPAASPSTTSAREGATTTTAPTTTTAAPTTTGAPTTTAAPPTGAPQGAPLTTAPPAIAAESGLTAPAGCEIPIFAPNLGVEEADLSEVAQGTPERADRSARSATLRGQARTSRYVVVMGDSYSSGEGTGWKTNIPYERGACHNTWANYGGYSGAPYANIACSGAVTADVLSRSQNGYARQIAQLSYLVNRYGVPNVVMFSIGGNDLHFGAAVKACIRAKMDPRDRNTTRVQCNHLLNNAVSRTSLTGHYNRVSNVIRTIRATAPGANIMVIGYPALFAKRPREQGCAVYGGTAARIRSVTRIVNTSTHKAANDNRAVYVSTTPRYQDHHLCDGNGDNDWFVPAKATFSAAYPLGGNPEAAHPRWNGHRATGDLIRECWGDWARCRGRGYIRSARSLNASGGATELVDLEDDQLPDAPQPAKPPAPTVAQRGSSVVVTFGAVANATTYEVFQRTSDGDIAVADSDTPGAVTVEPLPTKPQCFGIVAVADDEAAAASDVVCVAAPAATATTKPSSGGTKPRPTTRPPSGGTNPRPAPAARPTPPTTAANRPPVAISRVIGVCKGSAQGRSVAGSASDPDGRVTGFELVSTSFGRGTYRFRWVGNGSFFITIPRNNTAATTLTIRWRAIDNRGAKSAVASLDIRPASC